MAEYIERYALMLRIKEIHCADCACYRCEHLHHCYGQCAKRGCAE